mgnify:CR=1 FL=1
MPARRLSKLKSTSHTIRPVFVRYRYCRLRLRLGVLQEVRRRAENWRRLPRAFLNLEFVLRCLATPSQLHVVGVSKRGRHELERALKLVQAGQFSIGRCGRGAEK